MQANEDDVYSHQVARRSVARAALHVGLDSMSEEALDVLGDVLLTYLQRIGKAVSSMVESSNRSSAHANVLDALKAIDMCTSPAVHQVHLEGENESNGPLLGAWQDLAVFLFGPDWRQQQQQQEQERLAQSTVGGKIGPSTLQRQMKKGWDAPHFDEIPDFPQASPACANPHTLPRSVAALALYPEVDTSYSTTPIIQHEQQLESMPDEAFVTEWGAVQEDVKGETGPTKRKRAPDPPEGAPAAKHVKFNDGKKTAAPEDVKMPTCSRPPHVPSFLPPFPKSGPDRAILAEDTTTPLAPWKLAATAATAASTTNDILEVRSSLVKMEQHYWGSGWDAPAVPTVKVPPGRTQTTSTLAPSVVQPLGRPSQNRSSRILEGSMDAMN